MRGLRAVSARDPSPLKGPGHGSYVRPTGLASDGGLSACYGSAKEANMDNTTLLIIIILVVILLGGGWYGRGRWF